MKTVSSVLAFLVAVASLAPVGSARPPRADRPSAPHHDCCCPRCPGPGLCPCDTGAPTACLRSSDDLARDLASPDSLPPLKMACESILPIQPPGRGMACDVPESFPLRPLSESRLDKVPISFA